jgi:hypothetical protein
MWIKQQPSLRTLLEKWAEPFSAWAQLAAKKLETAAWRFYCTPVSAIRLRSCVMPGAADGKPPA